MDRKDSHAKVFFALWPGKAQREALADWQPTLRASCGGRPMRADSLHCTLVFLGNVATRRLEALKLAAEEVQAKPFSVMFDRAAYWGHNHIVYGGPSVTPPELSDLVTCVQASLRRHRFRYEHRDYVPHITLLRHAKWGETPLPAVPAVSWPANEFALLQSLPQDAGTHYEVLARFPLK